MMMMCLQVWKAVLPYMDQYKKSEHQHLSSSNSSSELLFIWKAIIIIIIIKLQWSKIDLLFYEFPDP